MHRRPTISAAADELQVVREHRKAKLLGEPPDLSLHVARLEWLHAAAIRAHGVVMVAGLTHDVAMAAITRVHAIENAQLGEQVQCSKDRCAANVKTIGLHLFPGFLSAEVMISGGQDLNQGLSRSGKTMALLGDAIENLGGAIVT